MPVPCTKKKKKLNGAEHGNGTEHAADYPNRSWHENDAKQTERSTALVEQLCLEAIRIDWATLVQAVANS